MLSHWGFPAGRSQTQPAQSDSRAQPSIERHIQQAGSNKRLLAYPRKLGPESLIVRCKKMKQVLILTLAVLCSSGCARYILCEPLPAFVPSDIRPTDLPVAVRSAILEVEPDGTVVRAVLFQFQRTDQFYHVTVRMAESEKTYSVHATGGHCTLRQEEEAPNNGIQAISTDVETPDS